MYVSSVLPLAAQANLHLRRYSYSIAMVRDIQHPPRCLLVLQRGLSDIRCETGVLWSGDHLFPGTVETLDMLRSKGMHGSTKSIWINFNLTTLNRQASRLRHEQQYQIARGLHQETRELGNPRHSSTYIMPASIHPDATLTAKRKKSSPPPTAPQSTSRASSTSPAPSAKSS